ncbi:MAG TPA: tetratricopeptide repeat protein [Nitrospira sp.]|nr:sel1 repeat family protein [Nitrospira sp.]MCC7214831.1 sel1 repeat family protein [Nitrospira sp.]HNP81621.1 tetratricopeptide repeat protein [Nitrospira sp.]HPW16208.1 tetratricopeptide repeat protein [Nitrospira sp.]
MNGRGARVTNHFGWRWLLAATMVLLSCPLPSALADPSSQHQLQALAGQGDANAQWMLGQALLTGSLGETDEAEAVRWLQLAADQGHALAQRDMGMLYEQGQGVTPDVLEAFFWYSLASRQDSSRARLRRDALAAMLTAEQHEAIAARLKGWRPRK